MMSPTQIAQSEAVGGKPSHTGAGNLFSDMHLTNSNNRTQNSGS